MQGLQVFDGNGNVIIDSSKQTTSIFGYLDINTAGTFTVTDARFSLGTPFYLLDKFYIGIELSASFSGNSYTFVFKTSGYGGYSSFRVYYGVY